MKPRQPSAWTVVRSGNDEFPGNHYLRLNCARMCEIPLSTEGAKEANGTKRWGWNGDRHTPTVTPSIDCQKCGWHKTVVNGSAT